MRQPAESLDRETASQVLDEVVDQITERLQAGEAFDPDEYVRRYPELEDQLRKLLPGIQMLADLGHAPAESASSEGSDKNVSERPVQGVLGDYQIVREVGRGGMGVVYEAEQVSLSRKVALKVLPFAAMLDQRQLQRFQNEARAAASLKHPSIVQVYAVGCERAVHFYAMEYVEGQTLAEVIQHLRQIEGLEGEGEKRKAEGGKREEQAASDLADSLVSGRFAPGKGSSDAEAPTVAYGQDQTPGATVETTRTPQAAISTERSTKSPAYFRSIAEIGVQVAEALDHAHEHGMIHRDVKPSNVILDNAGKPWVTDFGLARIDSDATLTASGDLLGTVRYMSPEQALAKRIVVDHRTDVYSLGATLYELLTLQPVFCGQDRNELLRQIAFDEPKAPRRLNKAVPEELEIIVLKAMAKNPAERYDTAQELADDLRRFLEDRPIRARRPTLVQRAAKWSRRHKPVVWSAAVSTFLLLVIGLVGLGIGNVMITKERDAKDQALVAKVEALDDKTAALKERREALLSAEANLLKAEAERRRAESNLTLALDALDSVYLHAIGQERLLGGEAQLSEQEERLLEIGLDFYAQLAAQNEESTPATYETARAFLSIAYLQSSMANREAAHTAVVKAIAGLEELTNSYPDNADYFQALGSAYVLQGCLSRHLPGVNDTCTQGAGAYDKVVKLRPDDDVAWANRGFAYCLLGAYDKAIGSLDEAIRLNPKCAWAYKYRAQTHFQAKEYQEAIADSTEAIQLVPEINGYQVRAAAHVNMNNWDLAIADANESIRICPSESWAYQTRGWAHGELGDFDRAIADLSEALRLTPKMAWTWELRTKAYLELGRYDEALADWERLAAIKRDIVARTVLIRAQILLMADRTEEYRQTCVEMLDRFGRSDDPGEVYPAARACVLAPNAISDPMRAVELAAEAQSSLPQLPWITHAVGMAHFRAGQLEEAEQRFNESLDMDPTWESRFLNWLGLALVHGERGETDEGRRWLGKATDLMKPDLRSAMQDRIESRLLRREVEQLLGEPEEE